MRAGLTMFLALVVGLIGFTVWKNRVPDHVYPVPQPAGPVTTVQSSTVATSQPAGHGPINPIDGAHSYMVIKRTNITISKTKIIVPENNHNAHVPGTLKDAAGPPGDHAVLVKHFVPEPTNSH